MNIKNWLKKNVHFCREEKEVRDFKGYGYTLAAGGISVGLLTGLVVMILQMAVKDSDTVQTLSSTAFVILGVGALAYMVWLILPMFQDPERSVGNKVVTALFSLACTIIPFILGIYAFILMMLVVIGLVAFFVFGKIMFPSKKKSKKSGIFDSIVGPDGGELYGDRVDKDTFYANGTTYKRTYDGFAEVWKEE